MLSYLTIGANDIPRSERFYTAVLVPLGYEKAEQKDAVIYTLPARVLIEGAVPFPEKTRGASEGFVRYESAAIQARLGATWGLGETGASGPAGNRYGDPAGHAWVGVAGPDGLFAARNVLTGDDDRERNMVAFGVAALDLLADTIRGVAQ